MARLSPSARALRDLQNAIHRHSGKALGDVARRAVREHADDPDASDRELTLWLWGYIYGEAPPEAFAHPVDDLHTCFATAALYTMRSAPETIVRTPFTVAELRALRRARSVIAEVGALPELTARRWRHLVGLKGSPLDLTFHAAAPDAAGIALCWEPGLEQTAIYPHDILDFKRSIFEPAQVIVMFLHEEVHLALSTRTDTRQVELSPLRGHALELAADTAEAIAFGYAHTRPDLPQLVDVTEYLAERERVTANVLIQLPKITATSDVLRMMFSLSAAAQESDDQLLSEARRLLRSRMRRRTLENLLGLS